ncbi:unnamed protein product, partial [Effrenium voratum]
VLLVLGHVIPAVGSIAEHYTKVPLEEVARKPASICDQLKASGFAVVRCNLKRRAEALEWLGGLSDRPAEFMSELSSTQFQGVARVEEVEFPRKLRRVDLVPVDVDGASDGPKATFALARDLHDVAVTCLRAIAEHERMPLEELVADRPERLNSAKEPSFLRANLYNTDGDAGACWHVDLGLLTVMPVGSWPAMMASPFHSVKNSFVEELLDPDRDVLVFAGTALAVATAGLYVALVHGVSGARLRQGCRVSLPYFLRVRRGAIIQRPRNCPDCLAGLYPAAVQPSTSGDSGQMLDLLRFHRDFYGRLCTRGQVVPLGKLGTPDVEKRLREGFYT